MASKGGGDCYTVGYRYYLTQMQVLCQGPADAVLELECGDRQAWTGTVTDDTITVNAPNLFGGEEREGGIAGPITIDQGGPDSSAPRGVVSAAWEDCLVACNNPYLKDCRWRARRTTPADDWYPEKSNISGGMNPAHILHELITSTAWGLGYSPLTIDDAAWQAVADTLYAEGFSLNLVWADGSVEDLAQEVLNHIEGRLYVSPRTGLWVLDLLRSDDLSGDLPLVDASVISSVDSYERRGWDETINEIVVEYLDTAGKPARVTAQNLANVAIQGGVVSASHNYRGVNDANLAARLAERDLRALSRPLARWSLRVNRLAWAWGPGTAVRISWPEYGVSEMVCRVAQVDAGLLTAGEIRVELVEDCFGVPSASYLAEQPSTWTDPVSESEAAPCPHQTVLEAPYWDVVHRLTAAELAALVPGYGFLLTAGERPGGLFYDYRIWSDEGAGYVAGRYGTFTPTALLADAIDGADNALLLTDGVDLQIVAAGAWADLDGELVKVQSIDTDTGVLMVERGMLDTTPVDHAEGARIWFAGQRRGIEGIERVDGEAIDLRLTPRSTLGTLDVSAAPTLAITLDQRAERPYPPGRVRINDQAWPTEEVGDLAITWAHRDRLQQTAYLVTQDETDIGPEDGTTYTVRLYNAATDTLERTYSGLTGTSLDYSEAQRKADFGGPYPVRIEITAYRDGLASWTAQSRTLTVSDTTPWPPTDLILDSYLVPL